MHLKRRSFLTLGGGLFASFALPRVVTASSATAGPPIIDVHSHAYPASMRFENPIFKSDLARKKLRHERCRASVRLH